MIIQGEEIIEYLSPFSYASMSQNLREKLEIWKKERKLKGLSPLEHIFIQHQLGSQSIRSLANEIGISKPTLIKLLKKHKLPYLTQVEGSGRKLSEMWEDEDFRVKTTEATRKGMYANWEDEDFRVKRVEGLSQKWRDKDFRVKQAESVRRKLSEMWEDEDFRVKQAESVRRARHDLNNLGNYFVPTLKGFRRDIQIETYSAWEANLARAILYSGRTFIHQMPIRIEVTERYMHLFKDKICETSLDFVTIDNRGNVVAYEIMSHPSESEVNWAKIEMAAEQHAIKIIPVTPRFYKKVEKRLKSKIENSREFSGWENSRDNLKINPKKYSSYE